MFQEGTLLHDFNSFTELEHYWMKLLTKAEEFKMMERQAEERAI